MTQAAAIDGRLLNQQVLVAALPDASGEACDPEVHLAWLMPSKKKLCLREASIGGAGEVGFGRSTEVPLDAGTSLQVRDRVLRVLGSDGRLLVQMHVESDEDGKLWTDGIQTLLGASSHGGRAARPAAQQDDDDDEDADDASTPETAELRARSAALTGRIRELETVGARRDKQLQKMVQRLEGAMRMLSAVQEMCAQQRRVIDAQQVAIMELKRDNGVDDDAEPRGHDTAAHEAKFGAQHAQAQQAQQARAAAADEEDEDDAGNTDDVAIKELMEAEITEKTEKMLALLKQADEMQQVLQQLEGAAGASSGGQAPSSQEAGDLASIQEMLRALSGLGLDASQLGLGDAGQLALAGECKEPEAEEEDNDDEDDDDDEEVDPAEAQAVLSKLQALEAEKKRFEEMLSSSHQEQQDLLKRLNDMEALKASMGWANDSDSGED